MVIFNSYVSLPEGNIMLAAYHYITISWWFKHANPFVDDD